MPKSMDFHQSTVFPPRASYYDDGDDWLLDFVDLEPSYRVADTSLALLPSSRSLSNFASACASISCGDPHGQLLEKTFQKISVSYFPSNTKTFGPDLERLERLDLDCWVGFNGPPPLYYLGLPFWSPLWVARKEATNAGRS
mgnify:CR=1 FL=1